MEPMDIRHNRVLAIACLVVGALLALVSLLGQQWVGLAAGAVLVLLGALMLVNPMVRIADDEVQLRSPIGVVNKRFPVSGPSDLTVDGKTLRHTVENKKVASLGAMAHSDDVASLRARLGGGSAQ